MNEEREDHTVSVYQNEMGQTWAWECSCLDEADEFEDEESASDSADQHVLGNS